MTSITVTSSPKAINDLSQAEVQSASKESTDMKKEKRKKKMMKYIWGSHCSRFQQCCMRQPFAELGSIPICSMIWLDFFFFFFFSCSKPKLFIESTILALWQIINSKTSQKCLTSARWEAFAGFFEWTGIVLEPEKEIRLEDDITVTDKKNPYLHFTPWSGINLSEQEGSSGM